jgi:hypothetical protein
MIDPAASHRLPAIVPHFLERRAVVIEWLKEAKLPCSGLSKHSI